MNTYSTQILNAIGAIETKQNFGMLPRTSNPKDSGQFLAMPCPDPEQTLRLTFGPRGWWIYKEKAEEAAEKGNFSQAEAMWLSAMMECKEFGENDERLAHTLDQLASLYFAIGKYEQAEMFCRQAYDVALAVFGAESSKVTSCLNNLAGIYYCQKRYADAEPICIEVLVSYEMAKGPDHADVGMAANNLAMLYHAKGNLSFAEKYYLQAIKIRTKALGVEDPIVQILFANYSNLLRALNRVQESQAIKAWTHNEFLSESKAC